MKYYYSKIFVALLVIFQVSSSANAQTVSCPVGYPAGSTAYDTTIITPTGTNNLQIKFPQFDPAGGMVTCVRLCITITGVVDSVSVENNSSSPQIGDVYYTRTDRITGPGLSTPLENTADRLYGPFPLGPTDGVLGSGVDFWSTAHDTVLNSVSVCRQLNDTSLIRDFYGHDSVTYNYFINARTSINCSGGNYNSSVSTSAFVRFRFEYCTCPGVTLPSNMYQFSAIKSGPKQALLKWSGVDNGSDNNYYYEAQMSRNGTNFETIGRIPRNSDGASAYAFPYPLTTEGRYFFRIKQVVSSGTSYFTNVRFVDLNEEKTGIKFIVYPNPSNGIVGIKFDNISAGKYIVLINNTQGQVVINKEIQVSGNSYQQVATLNKGFYWVRMVNAESGESTVNQLLIK